MLGLTECSRYPVLIGRFGKLIVRIMCFLGIGLSWLLYLYAHRSHPGILGTQVFLIWAHIIDRAQIPLLHHLSNALREYVSLGLSQVKYILSD